MKKTIAELRRDITNERAAYKRIADNPLFKQTRQVLLDAHKVAIRAAVLAYYMEARRIELSVARLMVQCQHTEIASLKADLHKAATEYSEVMVRNQELQARCNGLIAEAAKEAQHSTDNGKL